MEERAIVVIGAGLAGLTCARVLQAAGRGCVVLEAGDDIGGRVRTDEVDGYLLDRGFQVFLTAYPEARRWLDYRALDLRTITPGTLVWKDGAQHRLSDPLRRPQDLMATLRAPVGSLTDKVRIGLLRRRVGAGALDALFARPETTTLEALRAEGFGAGMIEGFLRPWLGGIFLDWSLSTSSRMMEFVFRMFAEGDAALPASGMQAIPRQLATGLTAGTVRTGARVERIDGTTVHLAGGETLRGRQVVVATDGGTASRLVTGLAAPAWRASTTIYFAAERSPLGEPTLCLNGSGRGLVNTVLDLSAVAPEYAPPGKSLLSVSLRGELVQGGDERLAEEVRGELGAWFGRQAVAEWRLLRTDRITQALPRRFPLTLPSPKPLREGLWVCGDHHATASIQGAMQSGRETADAILAVS
jgi:phytoene dehydrogenase-like protein